VLHIVSITHNCAYHKQLVIIMKIASFFIALFVGVLTPAPAAAQLPEPESVEFEWQLVAPQPQANNCNQFGSAYTGKSGKGYMSMSKSGKGLQNSKSSKANSELGNITFTLRNEFIGVDYTLFVSGVHPMHCVGEIFAVVNMAVAETFAGASLNPEYFTDQGESVAANQTFDDYRRVYGSNAAAWWGLFLEQQHQDQNQDEPVRS
jgi:hypothetical protein